MPIRNGMHRAKALSPIPSRSANRIECTARQRSLTFRGALTAWRPEPQPGASKIAILPNEIREQLNLRLLEGETGEPFGVGAGGMSRKEARELAAWLNALPKVQSMLGSQFNGSSISEVNLTSWRQGGYLQWVTERKRFDSARALADGDCDLAKKRLSASKKNPSRGERYYNPKSPWNATRKTSSSPEPRERCWRWNCVHSVSSSVGEPDRATARKGASRKKPGILNLNSP